ncbi:hypothetical protein SDC9_152229 [bioreactor metagenome]|uniref:Uncharacterized protein n=1 Tax=bioreactor metagenome TaxID=1076179 RepID=A0A645EU69_9ZZZZ
MDSGLSDQLPLRVRRYFRTRHPLGAGHDGGAVDPEAVDRDPDGGGAAAGPGPSAAQRFFLRKTQYVQLHDLPDRDLGFRREQADLSQCRASGFALFPCFDREGVRPESPPPRQPAGRNAA